MADIKESDLTVQGPEYYNLVPFDLIENLRFRQQLVLKCAEDEETRIRHWCACRDDFVYFLATTCWIYEPRVRRTKDGTQLPQVIPMIPWPHQIPRMRAIRYALGFRDICMPKSRGEGASWMGVFLAVHDFVFDQKAKIALISKDMDAVDKMDDMDSIMEKIDFSLKHLPIWMVGSKKGDGSDYWVGWSRRANDHVITNHKNGSSLTGFAATNNVASGGRAKWMMHDELAKFPAGKQADAMASTQHVTDSRFVPSTPKGSAGAFYDFVHSPNNALKVVLRWEDNPTKNRGLYRMIRGVPEAVDPENNPLPPEYDPPTPDVIRMFDDLRKKGFKLEKGVRSPWYDQECYRGEATPQNIAQELDRDFGGSAYRVFDDVFEEKALKHVAPPILHGTVKFDIAVIDPDLEEEAECEQPCIVEAEKGELALWVPIDAAGLPPRGAYAFGIDIAWGAGGTYSSKSTISIWNTQTSRQVGEWSSTTTSPDRLAYVTVALARIFYDAFVAWEVNGPGQQYMAVMRSLRYPNVYYHESNEKDSNRRRRKRGKRLGWHTNRDSKEMMFADFINAVKTMKIEIRSHDLVKECRNYVLKDGKIHHALVAASDDDADGVSHGDLVIGACIGYQAMKERPKLHTRGFGATVEDKSHLNGFAQRNMSQGHSDAIVDPWEKDPWDIDDLHAIENF